MVDSIGGQNDGNAHSTTQAQSTGVTASSTTANMPNGVTFGTLLTSMAALVNNVSNSSNAEPGSISSQASNSTDAPPSGLSDSQRVSEKDEGSKEDGEGGEERGDGTANLQDVNYTGSKNLSGITPMNTSSTEDAASSIELRSNQALAAANAAAEKNGFLAPNLAAYSTSINTMISNFSNTAAAFGLSSDTISQASASFEKAGSLASQLNSLSSQGLANKSTIYNYTGQINDSLKQGFTAVVSDFSQNPESFASGLTKTYGVSPEAANQIATSFSSITGGSSQSTSSSTTYNALDTTEGMTMQMDAVGGFAGAVSNGTALLDAYAADIFSINANIGTETVQESNVTTQNLQNEITKDEQEEKKEREDKRKGGLLGKIFHPFQTAISAISPVMVNVGAQMIHAFIPEVSTKQATAGLKDLSPKSLSNDVNKGIQSALKVGAEAICAMIPGVSMSAATEFMEIGFKAFTNPLGTEAHFAMEGLGKAVDAADPGAKSSVADAESIGNSFINDEATMTSSTSTPMEKMNALSSASTLAMTSLTTGLTNLICLADPEANRGDVEIAVTVTLLVAMIAASFFCPEMFAEDAEVGASLGMEEGGEEADMDSRAAIQEGDGAKEDALEASNATSMEELTSKAAIATEGASVGSSAANTVSNGGNSASVTSNDAEETTSIEDENIEEINNEGTKTTAVGSGTNTQTGGASTTGVNSSTTASKGAATDASIEDEDVDAMSEEGEERNAIVPGDGTQEDADAAANDFKTGMSAARMMNIAIQVTSTFQGIGTILNSLLTIQESLIEIDIASITYDMEISNSIVDLLRQTSESTNASTTNNTNATMTNISNLNTGNGIMSQDAAADLQG